MRQCVNVTSRDLLPVEILMGLSTIAWGIAGGYGDSGFALMLDKHDMDGPWFSVLFVTGLLQALAALIEWNIRAMDSVNMQRRLTNGMIRKISSFRCLMAFASVPAWIYAMFLVFAYSRIGIYAVLMLAPTYIAFNIWSFVKNLQVRHAINNPYPSGRLQFLR